VLNSVKCGPIFLVVVTLHIGLKMGKKEREYEVINTTIKRFWQSLLFNSCEFLSRIDLNRLALYTGVQLIDSFLNFQCLSKSGDDAAVGADVVKVKLSSTPVF